MKNEIKKADDVQVIKKKPRGGNSPVIGNNGLMTEPGDNARYMNINIELMRLRDIDLTDVEQVEERLSEYFEIFGRYDTKPTVVGMAIALNGHSRQWLWAVTHDKPVNGQGDMSSLPKAVSDSIKKAYFLLENLWENYMQNGKVNPVAGIFLGKNNFTYQDKTEYVLTPNTNTDSDIDPDSIKARYLIDSQSDSDSDSD